MKQSGIALRIEPKPRDLGEFTVRRTLPDRKQQMVGPFIFFDHMGPADFPPGSGINVRQHPHIGLATVTYLFEGEILHRDSLGYVQPIQPGAVNWMTAGRGIVHSEKVSAELLQSGQRLHGLQVWVALPEDKEEIEPRFEHYPAGAIPRIRDDNGVRSLVIGDAWGLTSPVRTESKTLYAALELEPDASIPLPEAQELALYVVEGAVTVGDETVTEGVMAVFGDERPTSISTDGKALAALLGGDPVGGRRHIWWNFVSSSEERIASAKQEWQDGGFDRVPGEDDFIPLP